MIENFLKDLKISVDESYDKLMGKWQKFVMDDYDIVVRLTDSLESDYKYSIVVFSEINKKMGAYIGYFSNKDELEVLSNKLVQNLMFNTIYNKESSLGIEKRFLNLN